MQSLSVGKVDRQLDTPSESGKIEFDASIQCALVSALDLKSGVYLRRPDVFPVQALPDMMHRARMSDVMQQSLRH
jgi:hypothetical protein